MMTDSEELQKGGASTNTAPKRLGTFGTETTEESGGRDRWGNRAAFYLAAVGSAVGFGNVWRFPALAKDYGGGAFFIPYVMALFVVGLPVLTLEVALGQYYQTGNVGCFGSFHPRFRGVGMCAIACAFMLVVYYSMLLSWVTRAFFESFGSSDPWADEDVTGEDAVGYFYNDIIGMDTLGDDLRPTRVVGANVGYSVIVWVVIWLCLAFGMKWTGRIAYFSMGLPILLLFIFLIRGVTLDGASDGIKAYIGEWDMSVLSDQADVWSTAVSQIFFSLSVTFGTMTAYGSHCPRGEPAFVNSTVVGIANCTFSFLSGFAVFAAMGHLAHRQGVSVDEIPYAGFSLVFGTWPVVFGTLKGGEHWVRLLFFDLFLLGIDSAFSILEAPLTVAMDYLGHGKSKKWMVAGAFCVLAFLLSIIYATDAGLIFLDTIDFYINFVFLLTGFFETLGAGWVYRITEQIETLGPNVMIAYMFTHFGSIIVACGFWFGLNNDNQVWGGFLALFLCAGAGIAVTCYFLNEKMQQEPGRWTWDSIIYELTLANVMHLRDTLSSVVGYLPWIWAFAMKNLIPQILLILFINLATSKNADGDSLFGHYEGYVDWPFQVLGILVVCFASIFVLVGFAAPKVFEDADIPAKNAASKMNSGDDNSNEEEIVAVPDKGAEPTKTANVDDEIVEISA